MYAPTNRARGFSLIEGLVAISLTAIALVTVLAAVPLSLQANKRAELESLASVYARAKLESVLTTSYDEIGTGTIEPRTVLSSDPNNPAAKLYRTTTVTLLDSNFNTSASDQGLKKITVTVDWPNPRGTLGAVSFSSVTSQR